MSSAEEKSPTKQKSRNTGESDISRREESRNQIYHDVLVNEVLPNASPLGRVDMMKRGLLSYSNGTEYRTHDKSQESPLSKHNGSRLSLSSQKVLQTPKKLVRYISKTPFKVLDAPELQDDFYLNLVDWSSTNILAVGLGSCVYLWAANTSKVFKVLIIDELCDLSPHDSITSVNWMQRGTHLAVGTSSGIVQLWDSSKMKKVRQFKGHEARVGSMTWNESILSSGSRDRSIIQHDVRDSSDSIAKLAGHRQEVCGLKWNPEGTQMASGGNDNKLLIWDARNPNPIANFTDHTAAVKAIAWSPQQVIIFK